MLRSILTHTRFAGAPRYRNAKQFTLVPLALSLVVHLLLLIGLSRQSAIRRLPSSVQDTAANIIMAFDLQALELQPAKSRKSQSAANQALRAQSTPKASSKARAVNRHAAPPADLARAHIEPQPRTRIDWRAALKSIGKQDRASAGKAPWLRDKGGGKTLAPPSALSRDIAQAARQDCRHAHANLGLFAIPVLIFESATDTGCKW